MRAMGSVRDFDRGKKLETQMTTQATALLMHLGASSGLQNLQRHKEVFDEQLVTNDYTAIRALIVDFDRVPDLMCTTGLSPDSDFEGRAIQDLGDLEVPLDYLGFSLLAAPKSTGVAVFSWHESSERSAVRLIESFLNLPDARKADALLRLALEHSENVFLRPSWWEGLGAKQRDAVLKRVHSGLPTSSRAESALIEDGLQLTRWSVTGLRGINLGALSTFL